MDRRTPQNWLSRRSFLKAGLQLTAGASLSLLFAQTLWADPLRRWFGALPPLRTVRVKGRITLAGKPLKGVRVTDGRTVVRTAQDGTYTLLADGSLPFVYLSLPAGVALPKNLGQATTQFYTPLAPQGDSQTANWELTPQPDAAHRFLVFADPQPRDAGDIQRYHTETIADAKAWLQANPGPDAFAVGCGDIMWDDLSLLPRYEDAMRDLGIPAFSVVGNHDLDMDGVRTDQASVATFQRYFGPTYYSFDRGEVRYVVLDNVFWYGRTGAGAYMGYLDELQLDWLRQDLADLEAGRRVVVFTHIPMLTKLLEHRNEEPDGSIETVNRALLYALLEPYDVHFINGHMHHTEQLTDGGATHHTCGAACGAWWTGPICYDGTPSGYGIYEVNGSNVSYQYKGTGLPLTKQMALYAPGALPKAPDELVANVWGASDAWQVNWLEDGIRKGRMARRVSLDPQAIELYNGRELPARHAWVDPEPSAHVYFAPISPEAKTVVVEATDTFGRTYTEAWQR